MTNNNKVELDESNLEKVTGGGGFHHTCSAKCSCGGEYSGDINLGMNQTGTGMTCSKCGTKYQYLFTGNQDSVVKLSGSGEIIEDSINYGTYCISWC